MQWFIRKGDVVEENKPKPIAFEQDFLVSKARKDQLKSVPMAIWADSESPTAPIHRGNSVKKLVTLNADLTHLSQDNLERTKRRLTDGKYYYVIEGSIEAIFSSALTKYMLFYQGKRYDTITAEYA
jgi:hypothetical protein